MEHDFNLSLTDIEQSRATLLQCPDCRQMEIWSLAEHQDHGMCRTYPTMTSDGMCPACGEEPIAPIEED